MNRSKEQWMSINFYSVKSQVEHFLFVYFIVVVILLLYVPRIDNNLLYTFPLPWSMFPRSPSSSPFTYLFTPLLLSIVVHIRFSKWRHGVWYGVGVVCRWIRDDCAVVVIINMIYFWHTISSQYVTIKALSLLSSLS